MHKDELSLLQTHNNDVHVTETSACATALTCGVKWKYETIVLDSTE